MSDIGVPRGEGERRLNRLSSVIWSTFLALTLVLTSGPMPGAMGSHQRGHRAATQRDGGREHGRGGHHARPGTSHESRARKSQHNQRNKKVQRRGKGNGNDNGKQTLRQPKAKRHKQPDTAKPHSHKKAKRHDNRPPHHSKGNKQKHHNHHKEKRKHDHHNKKKSSQQKPEAAKVIAASEPETREAPIGQAVTEQPDALDGSPIESGASSDSSPANVTAGDATSQEGSRGEESSSDPQLLSDSQAPVDEPAPEIVDTTADGLPQEVEKSNSTDDPLPGANDVPERSEDSTKGVQALAQPTDDTSQDAMTADPEPTPKAPDEVAPVKTGIKRPMPETLPVTIEEAPASPTVTPDPASPVEEPEDATAEVAGATVTQDPVPEPPKTSTEQLLPTEEPIIEVTATSIPTATLEPVTDNVEGTPGPTVTATPETTPSVTPEPTPSATPTLTPQPTPTVTPTATSHDDQPKRTKRAHRQRRESSVAASTASLATTPTATPVQKTVSAVSSLMATVVPTQAPVTPTAVPTIATEPVAVEAHSVETALTPVSGRRVPLPEPPPAVITASTFTPAPEPREQDATSNELEPTVAPSVKSSYAAASPAPATRAVSVEDIAVEAVQTETNNPDVLPGEPANVHFLLTNQADVPLTVMPTVQNSLQGWSGTLLRADGTARLGDRLTIAPRESLIVVVALKVPANARLGDRNRVSLRLTLLDHPGKGNLMVEGDSRESQ